MQVPVLYPFGYGLSYTSFTVDDVQQTLAMNGQLTEVQVIVHNTGGLLGASIL